jgi:hypothetical protein
MHILSHMTDHDCVTMNMKWIVVWQTTVSYWIPNNNEFHLTNKAGFDKIGILCLGPYSMYHYFPEDTTHAILIAEMVSINHWYLKKIIRAIFKKIYDFVFWGPSEGPLFLELECSYLSGTDLWCLDSWILNTKIQIHQTVQVIVRCTSTEHRHIQIDSIPKTTFHIQRGSKDINLSKSQDWFSHDHNTFSYILHIRESKMEIPQKVGLHVSGAKQTCSPLHPVMNSWTWAKRSSWWSGVADGAGRENLTHRTARPPSECCCKSNVSSTLSKCLPFFISTSVDLFSCSHSSRKLPAN